MLLVSHCLVVALTLVGLIAVALSVGTVRLTSDDIVRHHLIAEIERRLSEERIPA
jgi:hypothetical protein